MTASIVRPWQNHATFVVQGRKQEQGLYRRTQGADAQSVVIMALFSWDVSYISLISDVAFEDLCRYNENQKPHRRNYGTSKNETENVPDQVGSPSSKEGRKGA